jgi:hypothetical protein
MSQQDRDLGFRIVHDPQSPTADMIFIHGLNDRRSGTGTNRSQEFQLPSVGERLPDVRVCTYGYNAEMILGSRDSLRDHATEFLNGLSDHCSVRILF